MSPGKGGEHSPARVVFVTHPEAGIEPFVHALVEDGLAACVNRMAATSTYRWEGKLLDEPEYLLFIKTRVERLAEIESRIRSAHPYDVPEILVIEPVHVEARYLAWLLGEVADAGRGSR